MIFRKLTTYKSQEVPKTDKIHRATPSLLKQQMTLGQETLAGCQEERDSDLLSCL